MTDLQATIEAAFEQRRELDPARPDPRLREAIEAAIAMLDAGTARVAEKTASGWVVNQWLKKAVLLYFAVSQNRRMDAGFTAFYDKVPPKFAGRSEAELAAAGVRVAPPAVARLIDLGLS